MVQLLLNGLEQLRPLVAEVVDVQGEIHATLEPLSGQASNLTGVMSRLAGNIKLIALNAQIQAAQVGCGTGLEVLSERTTRISEEIYRLNAEVSAELDVVISGIDDTVAESAALHRDALGIRDRLAGASGDVERRLHAYRDAALAAFMEVGRTAEQLVVRNAESLAALKFSASAAAVIEPLCAALDTLAAAAATAAGDARPGDDTPRMLEDLRARYTMRSERVVHAAGAGATAPGAASNPAREPASEPGTDTPPDAADKGQPVPSPAAEFF
jgi:hypothetical protein